MKNSLQMKGLKISATPLQMADTNERRYEKTALAGILRHSLLFSRKVDEG